MSLRISNSFGFTCKVLKTQCERSQTSQLSACGLVELLKCLNAMEKLLLAKYFCQLPLNFGSFRVLRQLQQQRILTATEYICSMQDEEQLQLILIEFLQNEHDLLSNLFISAHCDSLNTIKLHNMLEGVLRNLYNALAENPKISNLNYLEHLRKSLPDEVLGNVCVELHLSILLQLHEVSDVSLAFKHFSSWINEGVDELTFVKSISDKLLGGHQQAALNYLFRLSSAADFRQWKYYLILVQSIASCCSAETTLFTKKYLKSRLQHVASLGCQLSLLHLLLTARAVAATTVNVQKNLDNYAQWYKQNIGEMTYLLTNEQFQIVLNILDDSVHYEQEIDYLEIHAAIAISPGGKLVQAYKTKCKAQLTRLKAAKK